MTDNITALMDRMSDSTDAKGQSPLTSIGLGHLDGPDLLQEALDNGIQKTLPSSFTKKTDANDEAQQEANAKRKQQKRPFDDIKALAKQGLKEEALAERETTQRETEGAVAQGQGSTTQPTQGNPEWDRFHSINDEVQRTNRLLQQQQAHIQRMEESRMQERAQLMQQMQAMQAAAAPKGPSPQEQYFIDAGIDPQMMEAYRQGIMQQTQAQQQEFYNRHIAPMQHAQEVSRFTIAVAKAKAQFPHFDKYFPDGTTRQIFDAWTKTAGLQGLARTDWDAQFNEAYRKTDYSRLEKELAEISKGANKETERKEQVRETQKKDLKQAPRASASGGSAAPNWRKELDALPSHLSFQSAGREIMAAMKRRG